jgi:multidrug efflux system outer membrane protein
MRRRLALGCVAAAALLVTGCAVGPEYARPAVDVPPAWRIDAADADDLANTLWWRQFDDPVLDRLIEQALASNLDLLIAAARVDQFAGQLTSTRAQFYPQVGYGLDASRNRASRVGVPALPPGADVYSSLYEGALSAQWQIDLFGRVRRQTEAAQAQVYASEQGRRGVVLSLVGSVASSYVVLRGLDRQLEIARATADNFADTKRIFDLRFKGGVVSAVEVEQVNSQYEQAQAVIPGLEQQIAAQENLIAVLLGRHPGPVERGKTIDELLAPRLPAGLPASLLERRPDILQAEQTLVAANANVGVAQSLYYPQLSLTGALGSVSAALGDFLSSASLAWGLTAALTGPIFTFGAIEGQVAGAEAQQREAVASYQRAILNAFRETNDALVGSVKKREESAAQVRRVAALREYARLSKLRWDNGYADYLEVLYAQNELFGAELSSVRSQVDVLTQVVAVYLAMGGGWVDEAARQAPQPRADVNATATR